MAEFTSRAVLLGLNKFLLANMPSLKKTYDDFPNPNEKLVYPCLTTMAKEPDYKPCMPYVIFKASEPVESGPNAGKTLIRKVKGSFDFNLQLDMWATSKPDRANIEKELFAAFNKSEDVTGISLQLTDYFDEWVHYGINGISYPDSEGGSQRNEWRTMIRVLVNCREVIESYANLIQTIDNDLEVTEDIPAPEEDDSLVTTI